MSDDRASENHSGGLAHTVAIHVMVRGRVQGVGYRAWTQRTALRLGLEGWARNRADGSVEAVFAGETAIVAEMIDACRRGPSNARVDDLEQYAATDADRRLQRTGERFSVLPTV
jgi:acylphosphatase